MSETQFDSTKQGLLTERIATDVRDIWRAAKAMSNPSQTTKITIEQYWVLRTLNDGGPMRIKDLASQIGVASSSPITISVKRLEQRKLVRRERGKDDERVVTVTLTDRGRGVYESWRNERRKALSSLFESLSEREKETLLRLLDKVAISLARSTDGGGK